MPIYEYRCRECGHQFDAIQKYTDAPLTDCPECDKPTVARCLSTPAIQFKGSGFYITDYKGGTSSGGGGRPSVGKGDAGKGDASKSGSDSGGSGTSSPSGSSSSNPSGSGGA